MDTQPIDTLTVMFADVAGSTKLYEQLGDVIANSIISEVIQMMQQVTESHRGTVIKTIGDEVMCRFNSVDDCASTAIVIQEKLQLGMVQGQFVSVRIGFHSGTAIIQADGDIFGDTVNTAARMAGIAKGRQIILSHETSEKLTPSIQDKSRNIDKVHVKGKAEPMLISELVWENAGVTQMVAFDNVASQIKQQLLLICNGSEIRTDTDSVDIQLGRSDDCDLVVDEELVSRFHAKISVRRGQFILTDQSTNGTYFRTNDGKVTYLRRDEITLADSGVISLGNHFEQSTGDWLINFLVTHNTSTIL
ncbi:MAG: FHA domain-containing protein [Kangiellaceae bacterium]|nr:FHA domain-containing protein [Kangiellaceae bacterium]